MRAGEELGVTERYRLLLDFMREFVRVVRPLPPTGHNSVRPEVKLVEYRDSHLIATWNQENLPAIISVSQMRAFFSRKTPRSYDLSNDEMCGCVGDALRLLFPYADKPNLFGGPTHILIVSDERFTPSAWRVEPLVHALGGRWEKILRK